MARTLADLAVPQYPETPTGHRRIWGTRHEPDVVGAVSGAMTMLATSHRGCHAHHRQVISRSRGPIGYPKTAFELHKHWCATLGLNHRFLSGHGCTIKVFIPRLWLGPPSDQQVLETPLVGDECITKTTPTGHIYTTEPHGGVLFSALKQSTGEVAATPAIDMPETDRPVMMPTRKQTRERDRRDRIAQERRERTEAHRRRRTPTPGLARGQLRTAAILKRPPDSRLRSAERGVQLGGDDLAMHRGGADTSASVQVAASSIPLSLRVIGCQSAVRRTARYLREDRVGWARRPPRRC